MNQAQVERGLSESNAYALEIIRKDAGINAYQAVRNYGHYSLTQRVSDMGGMGFQFAAVYEDFTDHLGKLHPKVAHYTLLGWSDPNTQPTATSPENAA